MRTTLDLPDELFRQLKARAALTETTVKDLLTRYVENGLRQASRPPSRRRSALPVITRGRKVVANVTADVMARIDDEEDRDKFRRSLGR
jgi:DNA-binding MarR family transcriptional regulator